MYEDVTTIHSTKALSSSMIVELIDRYPNLEEITCSPSVYKRTSKTYIDALGQLDIDVKTRYNWGAKSKSNGIEYYVQKLSNEGLSAKQISQKLDISLNRVYYLLKKSNAFGLDESLVHVTKRGGSLSKNKIQSLKDVYEVQTRFAGINSLNAGYHTCRYFFYALKKKIIDK